MRTPNDTRASTDRPLRHGSRRLRRSVAVTALALATAAGGVGCSGDEADDGATSNGDPTVVPSGEDAAEVVSDFEGIDLYPGSEPIGPMSEDGDTTTRSYSVTGPEPEAVLAHFTNELGGWTQSEVEDVGEALRTDFRSDDGRVLEVSATIISDEGTEERVQYSLVLTR